MRVLCACPFCKVVLLDLVAQWVWHPGPGKEAGHLRPLFSGSLGLAPTVGHAHFGNSTTRTGTTAIFYHKIDLTAFLAVFSTCLWPWAIFAEALQHPTGVSSCGEPPIRRDQTRHAQPHSCGTARVTVAGWRGCGVSRRPAEQHEAVSTPRLGNKWPQSTPCPSGRKSRMSPLALSRSPPPRAVFPALSVLTRAAPGACPRSPSCAG